MQSSGNIGYHTNLPKSAKSTISVGIVPVNLLLERSNIKSSRDLKMRGKESNQMAILYEVVTNKTHPSQSRVQSQLELSQLSYS